METSTVLAFVIAIIFFVLYYFRGKEIAFRKQKEESMQQILQVQEAAFRNELGAAKAEQETFFKKEIEAIQTKLNDSYRTIPIMANQQFDEFKKNEIDSLRAILGESAKESALADLEAWKIKYEMFYRQDAINRSQSVILGKVTEHLIPFHQNFPFNPKEARFIGSPIDMIVFAGIENEDAVHIHILEIKTGNSSLSKRQRLIRDAVENNRVSWRELNI